MTDIFCPETSSSVPGFIVTAPPERQHMSERQVLIISADGSNLLYPGEGSLEVHLVFRDCNTDEIRRWVENDSFCLDVPTDDYIHAARLVEQFEDPKYQGVTLVLESNAMGSLPYFELVIAPLIKSTTPLN